ncbi:MBL fold metallo-hydrolase [Solimonas variicoloris]|uniref:MBL fold metallo-hydrolase n=1 Tax=Solimonas variicoloris TaxID=254408 RepID=UPI0003618646|nr:MBL fold metallo-hydrolase [Solimonas variicoloris]
MNQGDVAPEAWQALPPPPAPGVDVQAARERILGADATDPATVKLWWYGVSGFIVAAGGHLFLFDAWESVGLQKDYVPIGREELVAIQPEAIFVGHGHFDHAADAGYIAGQTGAALIGSRTVCTTARARAAQLEASVPFACLVVGDGDTPPPGAVQSLRVWQDLPPLQVIRHVHSAMDPADLLSGGLPLIYRPELLSYVEHLNTDPRELAMFAAALLDDGGVGEPTGGTWAYQLRVGDFSLLWHDSAGPIGDDAPDGPALRAALAQLPDCVDVQLGAIVGFGTLTSGLRDSLLYVAAAHPQVFLPNHHDAWAPVLGGGAAAYERPWRAALATLDDPPELDYLRDPEDYLRPRTFRVDDPRWRRACAAHPRA